MVQDTLLKQGGHMIGSQTRPRSILGVFPPVLTAVTGSVRTDVDTRSDQCLLAHSRVEMIFGGNLAHFNLYILPSPFPSDASHPSSSPLP